MLMEYGSINAFSQGLNICVNSAFSMKDDYFVMLKKKEIILVFIALFCKYEIYTYKCTYKGRGCYAHLLVGLFFACVYVVNDNLSCAVSCNTV